MFVPSSALAATPEEAIAYLNRRRAAYGIPPVRLNQSLLKAGMQPGQPRNRLAHHDLVRHHRRALTLKLTKA